MKHQNLFLTSVLTIVLSCPAFATGISANAQSADCDNGTLGTYEGSSNLRAQWTANSITLNWYDDSTENGGKTINVSNASTSCTYDGGIVLPEAPTKTGYEFDGWKVRRASAAPTPAEQQTLDCSSYNDEYDSATSECELHEECAIGWLGACANRVETQYTSCNQGTTESECNSITNEAGEPVCEWYNDGEYGGRYTRCMTLGGCSQIPNESWCDGASSYSGEDESIFDKCYWTGSQCEIDY